MEQEGHVSLTLTPESVPGEIYTETETTSQTSKIRPSLQKILNFSSRKSLRRSWNQLPRCQRNLIILLVSALFVTFIFLLPGQQVVSDTSASSSSDAFSLIGSSNLHGNDRMAKDNMHRVPLKMPIVNGRTSNQEKELENVENVVKIPETERSHDENAGSEDANKNDVNVLESDLIDEQPKGDNHENSPEETSQNAYKLPGTGLSISEFIERMEAMPTRLTFKGPMNDRQQAVVAAFKHSWKGYKTYAWGHDNLKPLSKTEFDWFGLGLTIIDSLDTMYIMRLTEEFQEARQWVEHSLTFNNNRDVNLFEVTIRVLGGLLSTYHLSGEKIFLQKSIELGNRLLPSFKTPSGIPFSDVNLSSMIAHTPKWSPDSSTSEVTTIQMEFRDLSRITNVTMYEEVVDVVNKKLHALPKVGGLAPIFINPNTGQFRNYATISLGARGDSYYEYLLKQWIQTGQKDDDLIEDYKKAIDGIRNRLVRRTPRHNYLYIGELLSGQNFSPKMDHLTCYLPGTLLLGYKYGMPEAHLELAKDLLETCSRTYTMQPTGLAPEISYFALNENDPYDIYVKRNDVHNQLRPEFIESLYYFYVLIGDSKYQDLGWAIFKSFENYTKVPNGYTSIGNVKSVADREFRDKMESYWLGETLKYFYLLFSDDRKEMDLDKFVMNTEAHPLPIYYDNNENNIEK